MRTKLLMTGAAILLAGCGSLSPARFVATGTGLVSHQLCSEVFIGGRDPETAYSQALAPLLGPMSGLTRWRIDRRAGTAEASLAGAGRQRAVYRGGLGCVRADDGPAWAGAMAARTPRPEALPMTPPLLAAIAGAEVVEPQNPALQAAVDRAFAEPARGPRHNTQAVVVVRHGRIIAERYAHGIGPETPLTGWSMSKSLTNAMVGVLVRQGRLSVTAPAAISEWAGKGDPRGAITLEQLLRMESGLDGGQSLRASLGNGFDPAAQVLFDEPDMGAYAARRRLKAPPGSVFAYTDISYALVSRIVRDASGGDAAGVMAMARRELFEPLGMSRVTLEFDAAGTPLGGSHFWAPARDWARLGLLYLNDGMVGGRRILPEGWVEWSTRQTPGSGQVGYGAGFWTNRGASEGASRRIGWGMPADAYLAKGSFGQHVVIVPSADLVVVRMGPSFDRWNEIDEVSRLVKDVIAAG
ncbi:CubicO group peptidase (beta-lactamase class C family) [Caulobacter ginsengisoli]|uniref:CubicO group peptidase (Beta-lactamase class C family) n=1 Tax=Caulobacter ginsengisoli TaxID=400775 RepID=A0ABU0IP33_9CAUL|nr:serine hydrolase [Caulobacter ginsengisoli]MDQ0463761.1 CubicO group peptidase (beta-lactamase class C family) [Caulobacter ginsengisoli]